MGDAVWGGYETFRDGTLLEEVDHWRVGLELNSPTLPPVPAVSCAAEMKGIPITRTQYQVAAC